MEKVSNTQYADVVSIVKDDLTTRFSDDNFTKINDTPKFGSFERNLSKYQKNEKNRNEPMCLI